MLRYDFDKSFAISITKFKNCNFDASLFNDNSRPSRSTVARVDS